MFTEESDTSDANDEPIFAGTKKKKQTPGSKLKSPSKTTYRTQKNDYLTESSDTSSNYEPEITTDDEHVQTKPYTRSVAKQVFERANNQKKSLTNDSCSEIRRAATCRTHSYSSTEDEWDSQPNLLTTYDDQFVLLNSSLTTGTVRKVQRSKNAEAQQSFSLEDYRSQQQKVAQYEQDVANTEKALKTVNLSALPDNGEKLNSKLDALLNSLETARKTLGSTKVSNNNLGEIEPDNSHPLTASNKHPESSNTIEENPLDSLQHLHESLSSCPDDDVQSEDPKGLKIPLMPHQRRALAWILWRERQRPSGGILADDMGLGKTLTMISCVLKDLEGLSHVERGSESSDEESESDLVQGTTLVVCPLSLLNQWADEVTRCTEKGRLRVYVYHGQNRDQNARRLVRIDVIVTTYETVRTECKQNGALFDVYWHRIILDEAHKIKNHKSWTAEAVFLLNGKNRWALTGTPVHNKEEDLYSLLKFLRCPHFDDFKVWKKLFADKNIGGQERLNAVTAPLLLRRTKMELQNNGLLTDLPEKKLEIVQIALDADEMRVYQKLVLFSRKLFAQYLEQRGDEGKTKKDYYKMHERFVQKNQIEEVKSVELLTILLRLRQVCCHPSLIKAMLEDDGFGSLFKVKNDLDIIEQLNSLTLNDEIKPTGSDSESHDEAIGLPDASRTILNHSDDVFEEKRKSSKIKAVLKILKDQVLSVKSADKAVIVSQWTKVLDLLALQLKRKRIPFAVLTGQTPAPMRTEIVRNLNNARHEVRVLLLSLTAGGVGLNLVGANHLLLLDLHWNPQLEQQAQDRVYRMGQNKCVTIYKFIVMNTIEEQIKILQDRKISIADSVLNGSNSQQKLSMDDLKTLFNM